MEKPNTIWWQLDTGWGCGGVATVDGRITAAAPIFRKLLGQHLETVVKKGGYKVTCVS